MSLKRLATGLGVTAMLGIATLVPAAPAAAQSCHPSYGGCLPVVYDLDCWEIGYAVVQVWNVWDDPYGLDDYDGPGNGWTCDSYQ